MANVGGFEFTGSQALEARAQQAIQQMRSSGDLNQQLAANSQQVIGALFGSPEIRKAKQTEAALSDALTSVKKEEGESDLDFQIRQNNSVRDRMAAVDPNVAMQANEKILRLQSEKLEQRRLKSNADLSDLELNNALQTSVDSKTPTIFKRGVDGQLTAVAGLAPDATPEEINAKVQELQSAQPDSQYVVGSGLDRLKIEDLKTNSMGGLNKSSVAKIEEAVDATASLFFNGNTFMEQLNESPLSLTAGSETLQQAGGLLAGVRRIAGNFVQNDEEAQEDAGLLQDVFERTGFLEEVEDLGVDSAISRGLVLNMAYGLAKTLDPGGRLSDQDVEMAIQMLVGSGDPNALKKLIRARFEEAAFNAEAHRTRVMGGGLNGRIGVDKFSRYEEQRDLFFEKLDEFEEIIDSGGLLRTKTDVFGKTSQSNNKSTDSEGPSKRDQLRARLSGG